MKFLGLSDARWPEFLSRTPHDFDHLPAALAAYDPLRGAPSQLAVVDDERGAMLVPLRIFDNGHGSFDAASSEVRSAPLFTEGTDERWRRNAIAALLNHLQLMDVASLFLHFHPLLDSAAAEFARFGAVVDHGPTFDIPLNRPLEQIRGDMRRNHRRGVRQFHAEGYTCAPDMTWQHLESFHSLYSRTMERVDAREEFRFPLSFFEQLRDTLNEHVTLWATVVNGQLAMGHIVTECDGIVQALYAGVHPDYVRQIPQIGLYDTELEWAHEQGHREFFIDGGAQETLRNFKAGITKVQPPARSARIVIDPVEFGRQCALWEEQTERVVGRADEYFPPYRQPLPSPVSEPAHA